MIDAFNRLTARNGVRTEADIQADVRQIFLCPELNLDPSDLDVVHLESQLGDRRRIDIEVGSAVVEVKKSLGSGRVLLDATDQLKGYVELREEQTGRRYVGILTDGIDWRCFHLSEGRLSEVSNLTISQSKDDLDRLLSWLEGVLATAKDVSPTQLEIAARLGAKSSAYDLDHAAISSLYKSNSHLPTVRIKRELWARLLKSALGTQFDDRDDLFVEHTLLVNSAEIIAHAILGLDVEHIQPASLLSGAKFDEAGIHGVVESDFFDWILEVEGGDRFIRSLARRLARFDWSRVEQDVLKVLYESVIGTETRKRLGEYYTPDWLAEVIVDSAVERPLSQRVLDPACGSGTFLFHSVRKYMAAAEDVGSPLAEMLDGVTKHVIGMDLHPVAVTFARVTYLLAIGRERLINPLRGPIHIPVFLGDSLQWREQQLDLWTAGSLVIQVNDAGELIPAELRFPEALVADASRFDELVQEMASRASSPSVGNATPSLTSVLTRLGIPEVYRSELQATFKTMCRLHDEGRDHIWGYYIRNLARPMWLALERNRVDVIVGNPPWLSYRHMTRDMQKEFRRMSEARGLWSGAEAATHQDLSALFVARAAQLYLKSGGTLAMVLPNSVVDREYFEGFRSGKYPDRVAPTFLSFSRSWDLRRIRPHFFPRGSSVIFASRAEVPVPMPLDAEIWTGQLDAQNLTWAIASTLLERTAGAVTRGDRSGRSPYSSAFTQGAIFAPRLLFFVTKREGSPLGQSAGRVSVVSHRSVGEKEPWKSSPSIEGVVESEFVRPIVSGENLLPFRVTTPEFGVVPCTPNEILAHASLGLHPGLENWWREAERCWEEKRSSERLSLTDQLDYQAKLSKQLPIPALRVIYNASGKSVFAAKLTDRRTLVSSGLYWANVAGDEEADYLCAILNSHITSIHVRPFMSYGKDERHVHKHVWQLPIPLFDPGNEGHKAILGYARELMVIAEEFDLKPGAYFSASRKSMRASMESSNAGRNLARLLEEMFKIAAQSI